MNLMKKTSVILILCLIVSLFVSCLHDDDAEEKDIITETTMYISAETGTYCVMFGDKYQGMQYREKGDTQWYCDSFNLIEGFTYEIGTEYELLVEKTILANPPADSSCFRYKLIRIISQKKVTE